MGPLVSCLCVSRPSRWPRLRVALAQFAAQTYQNVELVVVVDKATDYAGVIRAWVDQFLPAVAGQIFVHRKFVKNQFDGLLHAGFLARGAVLALWDDDNLNHPDRLAVQVDRQLGHPDAVTCLADYMYYFQDDAQILVTGGDRETAPASERVAAATMMAFRAGWPDMDPLCRAKPAETLLVQHSRAGRRMIGIGGWPHLHATVVGGDNLRGYETHRRIAQAQARPADRIVEQEAAIRDALSRMGLPYGTVSVDGSDAAAFEYTTEKPDGVKD